MVLVALICATAFWDIIREITIHILQDNPLSIVCNYKILVLTCLAIMKLLNMYKFSNKKGSLTLFKANENLYLLKVQHVSMETENKSIDNKIHFRYFQISTKILKWLIFSIKAFGWETQGMFEGWCFGEARTSCQPRVSSVLIFFMPCGWKITENPRVWMEVSQVLRASQRPVIGNTKSTR